MRINLEFRLKLVLRLRSRLMNVKRELQRSWASFGRREEIRERNHRSITQMMHEFSEIVKRIGDGGLERYNKSAGRFLSDSGRRRELLLVMIREGSLRYIFRRKSNQSNSVEPS